jgi:hypothetical protein
MLPLQMQLQLTLLLGLSLLPQVLSQENCLLCGGPETPVRPYFLIGDGFMTCLDKYIELAPYSPNSRHCAVQQALYGDMCCGQEEPQQPEIQPTSAPVYTGLEGSEPDCPICGKLESSADGLKVLNSKLTIARVCHSLYVHVSFVGIPWASRCRYYCPLCWNIQLW